ncbi:COR domain-containing protein [Lusitaniella coriacea]|uniref:leucine-rich repeat domain-containing protein n=1 Tax=Lusitaniella coriacea TaxID=1983105 RepID=UPI003CEE41B3
MREAAMARDEAYREAERHIEAARREEATELDLSNLGLTELPDAIGQLVNLQILKLGYEYGKGGERNQLRELPEFLGNLTQLQQLHLSSNQLTQLPDFLGNLTQLQRLYLNFNQLTQLPDFLGNLTQLQRLYLSSNQLTQLPEFLGNLTQLQQLDLNFNQLTQLPEFLGNLTQLQQLDLNFNQLTQLPDFLGNLTQLQQLDLNSNQLTQLPDFLGNLTQLQQLDLNFNQLTQLPECLGNLTQLQQLYLNSNQLTQLPECLGNLTQLQQLYLNSNQLTQLPDFLGNLSQLQRLYLNDNPLNPELAAAYEQGLDAVKAYLQAKAKDKIVLNEAKLVFVGEGEVGKTSLLGALRGDAWVEKRPTTHGVEVDIKSLVVANPDSSTEITLNGWDFGGQNIYRHTHQLFFTAPAIYLAVWNPRRGPEQCCVDEWIKMVKHRAYDETRPDDKPRILVIATHGGPKERLDHIDEQALRNEFGNLIVEFHHVDSKSASGLEQLKQKIFETAVNIPQVGRTVPASWKRVLDAIRQRSETDAWITYEQFQTLCTEQKVDLTLAKTYAAILHELGHLIHYSSDPILKDTVILTPEWLSKAISFVLEDKKVKEQNGLVRHSRLRKLWDDPARGKDRYPKALHPVFIKLMERCDLSYQVELPDAGAPKTSLIAQLVPSKRPDDLEQDWGVLSAGDREQRQICRILDAETGRTVQVEGLIYRLIVRLHRYSLGRENYYNSKHWKNGLLLDDNFNGRAFIEEIDGDIYVTVRAAYPSLFLGHLCAEIEWLVKSFWKGLDPRLFIPCPTEACKGVLERDEIMEFKEQGMPKVRCAVCRKFHDIDLLMATAAAKPEWQDAVVELKQGQQEIVSAFRTNFDSLSAQLKTLMSQADEQFQTLLTTLTDPAKDCPRLFSLEPVNPGFWDKPNWIAQKFHLTLWCEHKRLPLPLLNPEGDTRGVYTLELTRDWIKRAAPLLRIMSVTLKLALPIALPSAKLSTDDAAYNAIGEQLEFGIASADTFLEGSEMLGDWLIEGDAADFNRTQAATRNAIRAQGSVLQELHALLKKEDPDFLRLGLERVQNKRREFVWVHPQFVEEYLRLM